MGVKRVGIYILWVLIGLVTGCIKEDRSDCLQPSSYMLSFIYNGDGTTDIFNSRIHSVSMYVFDTDGVYVNQYQRSVAELNSLQGIYPNLPPGEYDVICWGNVTALSEIIDEEGTEEDYFLYNRQFLNNQPIADFDSLYYGSRRIRVQAEREQNDTVYFRSAHIDMEVYIEGLSAVGEEVNRAVDDPQGWLIVRNVYTGYDFSMQVTGDISTMYPGLVRSQTGNLLVAAFDLFRFREENNITIDIYNGNGELVYTVNVMGFLSQHNIVIEGINEVTIPIYIKFDGVHVDVSVVEWDSENVRPIV